MLQQFGIGKHLSQSYLRAGPELDNSLLISVCFPSNAQDLTDWIKRAFSAPCVSGMSADPAPQLSLADV